MSDTTTKSKAKILFMDNEVLIAADIASRLKYLCYTWSGQATNCGKPSFGGCKTGPGSDLCLLNRPKSEPKGLKNNKCGDFLIFRIDEITMDRKAKLRSFVG